MMSMSLSHRIEQTQSLVLTQKMPFEQAGDFALFSLHRIKHRIPTMKIDSSVRQKLIYEFIAGNKEYRAETGNNWMCITPNYLDGAVNETHEYIEKITNEALDSLGNPNLVARLKPRFDEKVDSQSKIMKRWFVDNYDDLIYRMDKPIPYPIVMKLRSKLSLWALENINPFSQPIGEFLEDVAKDIGLNLANYSDTFELWEDIQTY